MKLILMSIIALLIFAAPAFSELTIEDLEKIDSIVKESEGRVMTGEQGSSDIVIFKM